MSSSGDGLHGERMRVAEGRRDELPSRPAPSADLRLVVRVWDYVELAEEPIAPSKTSVNWDFQTRPGTAGTMRSPGLRLGKEGRFQGLMIQPSQRFRSPSASVARYR